MCVGEMSVGEMSVTHFRRNICRRNVLSAKCLSAKSLSAKCPSTLQTAGDLSRRQVRSVGPWRAEREGGCVGLFEGGRCCWRWPYISVILSRNALRTHYIIMNLSFYARKFCCPYIRSKKFSSSLNSSRDYVL